MGLYSTYHMLLLGTCYSNPNEQVFVPQAAKLSNTKPRDGLRPRYLGRGCACCFLCGYSSSQCPGTGRREPKGEVGKRASRRSSDEKSEAEKVQRVGVQLCREVGRYLLDITP